MRRALLLLLLLCACSRKQPNILLVTFDTTRADRIDERVAPNVMALAKRGTSFDTALASQPLTGPSHATILTGTNPYHHGVRNNGAYSLAPAKVALAERLGDAGYATHAVVASYVLDSRFGFDQGFETYDDDLSRGALTGAGQREIGASLVADKALRWLSAPREKPFFLWLHFYDPHATYAPPAEIAAKFPGDPYAGEIHYADRELGRVLAHLREQKLLDDTVIAFTADHGESLGEHGEQGHGLFVYDSTTRVPLVFAGPGVPAGRRQTAVAAHADIVPTLLDLARIVVPDSLDGASLADWWDSSSPPERHAYSESFAARMNFGWSELRSMRSKDARVVDAPRREAYDLARDASEKRNLYGGELPPSARPLFAELGRIRAGDDFRSTASSAVDEETRRQLAALGYVMSGTPATAAALPDPKDKVATWAAYHGAQTLLRRHDFAAAATALSTLAATEPGSDAIATLLVTALTGSDRVAEALDVSRQQIERNPRNATAYMTRVAMLRTAGETTEARALLETVLRFEPDNLEARMGLAGLAMDERRFAEAEAILGDVLRRNPRSSDAIAALGDCLNRSGRGAEALALLRDGARADPNSHALAYNYAVLLEKAGQLRESLAAYQAALRLDPEHSMTWNNTGSLLDRAGRRREAIVCMARARKLDPRNVEATFNLGALLLATGRAREAIPLLEQAVMRRPDWTAARLRLAAARRQAAMVAESD